MLVITADTDWVPDKVLEYFTGILEKYGIEPTIFATHRIRTGKYEIGLHPNLETTYDKDHYRRYTSLKAADELKRIFPDAIGMRSHGLNVCTDMLLFLPKLGIKYDSSYLMSFQDGIKPYIIYPGVLEIPIYWMDIEAMRFGRPLQLSNSEIKVQQESESVYVYDFHPSHVFTNTATLEFYYDVYKSHYQDVDFLARARNKDKFGTCDALIQLLENCDPNSVKTMKQVFELHSRGVDYRDPAADKYTTVTMD